MYRQGITTSKIAAGAGVSETTVRYHLAFAARLKPSIRDDHRDAVCTPPRMTSAGRRNLEDILDLYTAEGRLPITAGASAREPALGVWLHRRRQEATQGTLSPLYKHALDAIPGWHHESKKAAADDARWKQRLA